MSFGDRIRTLTGRDVRCLNLTSFSMSPQSSSTPTKAEVMKTKEQLAEEKKLAMSVRIKKLNLDVSWLPRKACCAPAGSLASLQCVGL